MSEYPGAEQENNNTKLDYNLWIDFFDKDLHSWKQSFESFKDEGVEFQSDTSTMALLMFEFVKGIKIIFDQYQEYFSKYIDSEFNLTELISVKLGLITSEKHDFLPVFYHPDTGTIFIDLSYLDSAGQLNLEALFQYNGGIESEGDIIATPLHNLRFSGMEEAHHAIYFFFKKISALQTAIDPRTVLSYEYEAQDWEFRALKAIWREVNRQFMGDGEYQLITWSSVFVNYRLALAKRRKLRNEKDSDERKY